MNQSFNRIFSKGQRVGYLDGETPLHGVVSDVHGWNEVLVVLDGDDGALQTSSAMLFNSDKPLPHYEFMEADHNYSCDTSKAPENRSEPFQLIIQQNSKNIISIRHDGDGKIELELHRPYNQEYFLGFLGLIMEKYSFYGELTAEQHRKLLDSDVNYKILLLIDHAYWLGNYANTGINPAAIVNEFFDNEGL